MKLTKRVVDFVCSSVGLIALLPLFVLIGLVIKLHDSGPVFYRQRRVGRYGHSFEIWKFRTMAVGSDRMGPPLTIDPDPRITPAGNTLRRFKLDELPQLLNVLVGEMSLVGPRPEVPPYVALYTEAESAVLDLTPGMTDPASLAFFDESQILSQSNDPESTYVHQIMPQKIKINLEYAERANLVSDIGVIMKTLFRAARSH